MWTLTIILLLASGDIQVISAPVDGSLSGAACQARAQDVRQIERVGVNVVGATCARGRDV